MFFRIPAIVATGLAACFVSAVPAMAVPDARPIFEDYLERVFGQDPAPVMSVLAGRRAAPGNTQIVPVVVRTKSMQDPVSIPVVSADEYSEIDRLADAQRDTKAGSSLIAIASAEAREAFAMGEMPIPSSSPPALALLLMTFIGALAGAGAVRFFAFRRRSPVNA